MAKEFRLPDIGEGLTEGEIVTWFVKEGEAVQENDPLVEVMTEKVNVEIPSPYTGTVLRILAAEGAVVNVGDPIVVVGEEGEEVAEETEAEAAAAEVEEAPAEEEEEREDEPPAKEAPAGKVLAAPAIRKLAREMDVDLQAVKGTGARGRVTADDVRTFAEASEAEGATKVAEAPPETAAEAPVEVAEAIPTPAPAPPLSEDLVEHIPIRGVRRTISDHMHRSKTTAAHFTYVEEVDVTELVALREKARTWAEERGAKLTYLPFILKALVAALKEHPSLNATVDWDANEIQRKRYYNIGIATATDEGLIVPVLKEVDGKSLLQLAREVEALSQRAREGKLTLDEVRDSTFTITSLGLHGGVLATPIINPPEVAVLGIHKIAKRPMVRDGQIVPRDMMNVSLSFDHRIIDGHVGAAFTQALIHYLEDPGLLLLHSLEEE